MDFNCSNCEVYENRSRHYEARCGELEHTLHEMQNVPEIYFQYRLKLEEHNVPDIEDLLEDERFVGYFVSAYRPLSFSEIYNAIEKWVAAGPDPIAKIPDRHLVFRQLGLLVESGVVAVALRMGDAWVFVNGDDGIEKPDHLFSLRNQRV